MAATDLFVPLESIAPEVARRLQPGVKFQVSRRTFTEIAAERLEAMRQPKEPAEVTVRRIGPADLRTLRDAAAAQPLVIPGD
jgi:hypothetical protein